MLWLLIMLMESILLVGYGVKVLSCFGVCMRFRCMLLIGRDLISVVWWEVVLKYVVSSSFGLLVVVSVW